MVMMVVGAKYSEAVEPWVNRAAYPCLISAVGIVTLNYREFYDCTVLATSGLASGPGTIMSGNDGVNIEAVVIVTLSRLASIASTEETIDRQSIAVCA